MFAFGGVVPTGIFALFALVALLERRAWRVAASWPLWLLVAIAVGTATKVVYYGWGIEHGFIRFRGFSGHTLPRPLSIQLSRMRYSPDRRDPA